MSWLKGRYLWVRPGRKAGVILVVRKSLGNAVVRNRLKRRLRSLCRGRPDRSPALVIFPQPPAVNAKHRHLEVDLDDLLIQIGQQP